MSYVTISDPGAPRYFPEHWGIWDLGFGDQVLKIWRSDDSIILLILTIQNPYLDFFADPTFANPAWKVLSKVTLTHTT